MVGIGWSLSSLRLNECPDRSTTSWQSLSCLWQALRWETARMQSDSGERSDSPCRWTAPGARWL